MFRTLLRRVHVGALAVGPVAALSNASTPSWCVASKHDAAQHAMEEAARRKQYDEAMAWCQEHGKTAYAASVRLGEDDSTLWPLISEKGLRNRLSGKVDNAQPFKASAVLTFQEETDIVEACKELNRHGQGVDRADLGRMVLESLELRPLINRGRNYQPLSHNAKEMLKKGDVGQGWFTHFFANHKDIAEKAPCAEEIARAKWMTKENSLLHFKRLGECLTRAGVLVDGQIMDPRRVLNSDECPNPWGGTGGHKKVVGAVGEPCRRLVSAAREHTSLDVCIGLDGYLFGAHLIFGGKLIQRQMIPDNTKVPGSIISVTEKGYQTGQTLLHTIQVWDKDLVARGVPKPVVWMTDGHASRLSLSVLKWCRDNGWIMYLSPPHTTGIHQPLDQIFKTWHSTFNGRVKAWSDAHVGRDLNKAIFAHIFGEAWPLWTRPDSIVAAFRRCGVTVKGLDPAAIPAEKFVVSTVVSQHTPNSLALTTSQSTASEASSSTALAPTTRAVAATHATAATAAVEAEPALEDLEGEWKSPSPEHGTYRSRGEYFELKAKLASQAARSFRAVAAKLQRTPVTLKDIHPSFQPRKAEEPPEDKGKGRQTLKGEWGDIISGEGADLITKFEKQELDEQRAQDERDQRKRDKEAVRAEREEEEARKKAERAERLLLEQPVATILKQLRYIEANAEEISAGGLAAFAKANRTQLRALGVTVGAHLTKKALMPELLDMLRSPPTAMDEVDWVAAPPLALPAPTEAEPATEAMNGSVPPGMPVATAADGPSSAHGTPTKPPEKRTRRGQP